MAKLGSSSGRKFAKKDAGKHGFLFFLGVLLFALVVVAVGGLFLVAPRVLDSHRAQIADALGRTLDRKIEIAGPLGLALSLQDGVHLAVQGVSLGNPSWASRPAFAKLDRLEIGVGILPLLHKQIEIKSFSVDGADILMETNADGRTNWDFSTVKKTASVPAEKPAETANGAKKEEGGAGYSVVLRAKGISIHNSRIAMRAANGKTTLFEADLLTVLPKGDETEIHFAGNVAAMAIKMDMTAGALEKVMTSAWPFEMAVQIGNTTLQAKGTLKDQAKQVVIDTYKVTADDSSLGGKLFVDLRGARPMITGTVQGDKLDPAAFQLGNAEGPAKAEATGAPKQGGAAPHQTMVFSSQPLPLDGLKAVDVALSVAIDKLVMGTTSLQKLQTQLSLKNGDLALSPLRVLVGGVPAEGAFKLDGGRAPAALQVLFKANQMDLSQLAEMGGVEALVRGKGNVNIDLTASGNSPHALASSANGQINLIVASGTLYGKVLDGVGSALSQLLGGGGVNPGLNCMAARYVLKDGVMKSDGVVFDTDLVTVLGTGGVDFRDERISMLFNPQAKKNIVGSLTPPMRIDGTLASPHYNVDTAASVEKVAGLFSKGLSAFKTNDSATSETNACAGYVGTQNKPATGSNVGDVLKGPGSVGEKIQGVGDKLMKNLGSGLLKGFQ